MPGIAGIIRPQPYPGIRRDLDLMVESMRHESFYVGNQYVNRELGLHLGWLSHPNSLGACMPLVSRDRQLVLVMVGEDFSSNGKRLLSNDDGLRNVGAENLLQLYQQSEDKFFNSLNGWFSGVAIDARIGRVTLFNDRYGMARIYFHEGTEEFIFASEAKALLQVRPSLRSIEPEALAQYLRFNCVMGNKTFFKGVSLLPGASSWTFAKGVGPKKRAYFDFGEWEQQQEIPFREFYPQFADTLSAIVPDYMESSQAVALSLTSGLDTRAILAARADRNQSLPCYTFGGLWGETFDIRTARELARVCGLRHEVIRINEQVLSEFPGYARESVYISDGTHDALGGQDIYFNRVARKIAPIRLTGKFGSEVVRTRKLIPEGDFPRHLVQHGMQSFLDQAPIVAQRGRKTHPLSRVVGEEIAWYEFGRVSVEQSAITLRTPYMDNRLVKLMYQAPLQLRAARDLQVTFIKEKDRALGEMGTNLGNMGNSASPLAKLSYLYFWALFKIEFVYLYPTPHWVTRIDRMLESLKPERIIVGRQKFEAYRIWIKTHLADFVRSTLTNPQAGCLEFFDKSWIEKVVARHLAGTHNYLNEINKLLTIELICSSLLRPSTKLKPIAQPDSLASVAGGLETTFPA